MKDPRQQTIDIYNQQARGLSEKYRAMPPRVNDIELALGLAGNPERPRILEIGCADGRDAEAMIDRAEWYLGIDVAEELIKMARQKVPQGDFQVADAVDFDYPDNLDIVMAFASLIHLDRDELNKLYEKLHRSLRQGGVIYQSLKYSPEYRSEVKADQFGPRQYFFYNPDIIQALAGDGFEIAHTRRETMEGLNHAAWVEVALRKL